MTLWMSAISYHLWLRLTKTSWLLIQLENRLEKLSIFKKCSNLNFSQIRKTQAYMNQVLDLRSQQVAANTMISHFNSKGTVWCQVILQKLISAHFNINIVRDQYKVRDPYRGRDQYRGKRLIDRQIGRQLKMNQKTMSIVTRKGKSYRIN